MIDFNYEDVSTVQQLEQVLVSNIEGKEISYYFFYSTWDDHASRLVKKIRSQAAQSGIGRNIYLIDIFDLPNAIGIIKSVLSDIRPTISQAELKFYKIPQMVCIHKSYPRLVAFNSQLYSELGL